MIIILDLLCATSILIDKVTKSRAAQGLAARGLVAREEERLQREIKIMQKQQQSVESEYN